MLCVNNPLWCGRRANISQMAQHAMGMINASCCSLIRELLQGTGGQGQEEEGSGDAVRRVSGGRALLCHCKGCSNLPGKNLFLSWCNLLRAREAVGWVSCWLYGITMSSPATSPGLGWTLVEQQCVGILMAGVTVGQCVAPPPSRGKVVP